MVSQVFAISGILGMFGQFMVSIAQQVHKQRHYRVSLIAKNSPFSRSIFSNAQESLVNIGEYKLQKHLLDIGTSDTIAHAMNHAVSNEDPHGIIVRPIEVTDDLLGNIATALSQGIFVVLVDMDIKNERFERYVRQLPFFVGSNFSEGGELVAKQLIAFVGNDAKDCWIYLLLGPPAIASAIYRGSAIMWHICRTNLQQISTAIWLSDWNKESAVDRLIETLAADVPDELDNVKKIFIFCANDNIADHFLDIYHRNKVGSKEESVGAVCECLGRKQLSVMGYDGLRDDNNQYKLARHQWDNIEISTIDVRPQEQGRIAADVMHRKLIGQLAEQKRQELVSPKLVQI